MRRNKRVENLLYKEKLKREMELNPNSCWRRGYYAMDSGGIKKLSVSGDLPERARIHKKIAIRKVRRNNIPYKGFSAKFKKEYDLWWEIY